MICVTGGNGFLGTHLVALLRRRNHAVFAPTKAQFDLVQPGAAVAMLDTCQPETVVHLAARVGGIGANRQSPAQFFYDNLMMGVQLMQACRDRGVKKFVFAGTVCMYPKHADVPFLERALWDGYPEETNAPYALAKKALLVMAQAYRDQYGFNAVCVIPTNLYGPGDHFDLNTGHVIPAMIRKCIEANERGEREVILWGNGSPTREFLYVEDAARGIALATERYDKRDPVNLGSGDEVSIAALASMVMRACRFDGCVVWDKDKPNGQPRRKVSTEKAAREFGFRAKVDLADGLQQTVAWYKAQREGEPAHG